ncbi:MAG: phosphoribosyltransferase [Candidatus Magnetominusculus sp. LBB02]|nr:phosphoribosyltransferase [Candidatus Magnetominusculus sp. LBB02]
MSTPQQREIHRTLWPRDFPDIVIHKTHEDRDAHPCYKAAKAGDSIAAYGLVKDTISYLAVAQLRQLIGERKPLLVAVGAIEQEGFNAIPSVMAQEIAFRLNLELEDTSIVQSNRVGHTRARAAHRMVTPAIFTGKVQKGADYVIIDDHVGQGGTIANLRGFIEDNGGRVIAVSTLTESRDSRKLALRLETLEALERKYGQELDEFWRVSFGHGISTLTEAEGGNLLRQQSFDVIRTRMAKAADEARGRGFPAVEISRGKAGQSVTSHPKP